MKRRHVVFGGGIAAAFLVLAVLRLIVGNGVLWHFVR